MARDNFSNYQVKQKIKINPKLLIGLVIGIFIIGGLGLFLLKYYQLFSELGQQVERNPLESQAVNLVQQESGYQSQSAAIISAYLAKAGADNPELENITSVAKGQLLKLKVPASFKARHLQYVLLLDEISKLAAAGKSSEIQAKLGELRALAAPG